jgi:peptide/nickel transport system substrate-binding protein
MIRIRTAVTLVVVALLFAACGAAAPSSTVGDGASAPASGGTAPGEAKDGGTLVVAIPSDISRTDPIIGSGAETAYVEQNVVDTLVRREPGSTSKIIPNLASKWEISPDGLTYTFTLQSGVKFHDGTDFDAEAVKFNYERWKNLPEELQGDSYYAAAVFGGFGDASNVASVEATDPLTVTMTLRHPQSNFLSTQALPQFGIGSPAALKAGGADNTITDVSKITAAQGGVGAWVGTGPFKFKEWVAGDHVSIVKNPDYWDKTALAHVDEVIFKVVTDQTQTFNGLQAKEIDIAETVSPGDIKAIEGDASLQLINRGESCDQSFLGVNFNYVPVNNLKIRQAIAYAINKPSYIEAFYAGLAVPSDTWMPINTEFAKPLGLPTYDPDKARALIAESGETDLTIDFWYPSDVHQTQMPDPKGEFEAITRDLEAVGFTIVPHTATWSPNYLDDTRAGKYELSMFGWICDWASADNYLKTAWFGYQDGEPSHEFDYKNDLLDQTMNEALQAPDTATAEALWGKAQDMLLADMPSIPLVNSTAPAVAQAYVEGFIGSGAHDERMNTVWLNK